ncbi:MAG: hypothetical protein ABWZ40_11665 [Caulobacterales bacterium]
MKHGLAALAATLLMVLAGCDQKPAESGTDLEIPAPTAADLAANGTLGDWERASSDEKSAFLEAAANAHADEILKAAPSTSAEDALTASIIQFRECMDAFVFAGVDDKAMPLSSMLNQCETGFSATDPSTLLDRVYRAKRAMDAGAQPAGPAPASAEPAPDPAKKIVKAETYYPPPDFGE